eukprot:37926-Eustigmatos_ZCMA.PRE.1
MNVIYSAHTIHVGAKPFTTGPTTIISIPYEVSSSDTHPVGTSAPPIRTGAICCSVRARARTTPCPGA